MNTTNNRSKQIWESLRDPEFRKQFIDEHINVGVAFQIRSLRNRQKKKQSELAELLHVKQPLVSSWENPNYGNYSLNTLKDLAKAFDVGLLVRFVPFSSLVDWEANLTPDMIAPPDFTQENKTHMSLQVSTSFVSIENKDKIDKVTVAAEFINSLPIMDTLASTATLDIKEGIHA